MAYENSGMLGLVSPVGRGYLAGEQQGLTPEQMAQNGAITFAEAIALKQKADRMRGSAQPMQAQQMPQPQPTVVDDLRAQVMQGAGQPSRQGGIADLPAENVGNYNMASGGIVAFDGGGPVNEAEIRRILSIPPLRRSVNDVRTLADAGYSADADQLGVPKSPHDFRPVSAFDTPSLGSTRNDPKLLNSISPTLPEVASAAEPPPVPPEPSTDDFNQSLLDRMSALTRPVGGVGRVDLDLNKLYAPVSVSDEERGNIKKGLREEGEASGLPALLRRGTERVGTEIEGAKKGMTKDLWLAAAQAGFGIAGSTDPFLTAAGKAGQQFAGQYAVINKDMKKEVRELNKDKESYQRAMAEFELNQNAETQKRVENAQNRLESRQDKVAEGTIKLAELKQRREIAGLQANAGMREMQFRLLGAQLKDSQKAEDLKTQYAEAVRQVSIARTPAQRAAAQNRVEGILAAVLAYNKNSPGVLTEQEKTKNRGNGDEVVGADNFRDWGDQVNVTD